MDAPFSTLMANRHLSSEEEIAAFGAAVADLPSTLDFDQVRQLYRVLTDGTDYPEIMFEVLHHVEDQPLSVVAGALGAELPEMSRECPWWADTAVIRFLNNPLAWTVLRDQIASLPPPNAASLISVLERVAKMPQEVGRKAAIALQEFGRLGT